MKLPRPSGFSLRAFTLLELTVVIMVLMALISTGLFVSKKMDQWKLGRQASESLRTVYAAQRLYLADNPTTSVSTLTATLLIPYLPNQATAFPTVKSLTGTTLTIVVNDPSYPPYLKDSGGARYDPSASPANYTDSLGDVGE